MGGDILFDVLPYIFALGIILSISAFVMMAYEGNKVFNALDNYPICMQNIWSDFCLEFDMEKGTKIIPTFLGVGKEQRVCIGDSGERLFKYTINNTKYCETLGVE